MATVLRSFKSPLKLVDQICKAVGIVEGDTQLADFNGSIIVNDANVVEALKQIEAHIETNRVLEIKEKIIVDQTVIDANNIDLEAEPLGNFPLSVFPVGGIQQIEDIDYNRTQNGVSFTGLGLENFFEIGDEIIIIYSTLLGE